MSAEDGFLKRWSRRKRAVAQAAAEQPPAAPPPAEAGAALPELADLPPIESIEAASDIRPFLAPGVPTALSQAALRRAWSADPAIRDFIGLSENFWDNTAAGGVPGFGAIEPETVERLLKQVIGEPAPAEPVAAAAPPTEETPGTAQAATEAPQVEAAQSEAADPPPLNTVNAAMRDDAPPGDGTAVPARRRHGGALPE